MATWSEAMWSRRIVSTATPSTAGSFPCGASCTTIIQALAAASVFGAPSARLTSSATKPSTSTGAIFPRSSAVAARIFVTHSL